ncbi:uncharacterized protein LOC101454889 isoform X2 [Ceratitis capitata]|uniref:uncharacterized protein LOC101454889 isoform X2 n=1 Tax=Ceratitis capitata TaxID=7213 RepID=UPI000329B384|nr:uncharacterized protein LOC101454889 isoform X2 [Ceratitis capitata]
MNNKPTPEREGPDNESTPPRRSSQRHSASTAPFLPANEIFIVEMPSSRSFNPVLFEQQRIHPMTIHAIERLENFASSSSDVERERSAHSTAPPPVRVPRATTFDQTRRPSRSMRRLGSEEYEITRRGSTDVPPAVLFRTPSLSRRPLSTSTWDIGVQTDLNQYQILPFTREFCAILPVRLKLAIIFNRLARQQEIDWLNLQRMITTVGGDELVSTEAQTGLHWYEMELIARDRGLEYYTIRADYMEEERIRKFGTPYVIAPVPTSLLSSIQTLADQESILMVVLPDIWTDTFRQRLSIDTSYENFSHFLGSLRFAWRNMDTSVIAELEANIRGDRSWMTYPLNPFCAEVTQLNSNSQFSHSMHSSFVNAAGDDEGPSTSRQAQKRLAELNASNWKPPKKLLASDSESSTSSTVEELSSNVRVSGVEPANRSRYIINAPRTMELRFVPVLRPPQVIDVSSTQAATAVDMFTGAARVYQIFKDLNPYVIWTGRVLRPGINALITMHHILGHTNSIINWISDVLSISRYYSHDDFNNKILQINKSYSRSIALVYFLPHSPFFIDGYEEVFGLLNGLVNGDNPRIPRMSNRSMDMFLYPLLAGKYFLTEIDSREFHKFLDNKERPNLIVGIVIHNNSLGGSPNSVMLIPCLEREPNEEWDPNVGASSGANAPEEPATEVSEPISDANNTQPSTGSGPPVQAINLMDNEPSSTTSATSSRYYKTLKRKAPASTTSSRMVTSSSSTSFSDKSYTKEYVPEQKTTRKTAEPPCKRGKKAPSTPKLVSCSSSVSSSHCRKSDRSTTDRYELRDDGAETTHINRELSRINRKSAIPAQEKTDDENGIQEDMETWSGSGTDSGAESNTETELSRAVSSICQYSSPETPEEDRPSTSHAAQHFSTNLTQMMNSRHEATSTSDIINIPSVRPTANGVSENASNADEEEALALFRVLDLPTDLLSAWSTPVLDEESEQLPGNNPKSNDR